MEPNHPPTNHKPPSWPESSYFRDHLRQGFNLPMAHMDPAYSGSTQLGDQIYPTVNDYHGRPFGMHEAILRQIEKERIREKIIAEEIARRRILEAEVRMELLMERDMSMQRELDGAIYTPYLKSIIVDPKRFPNLKSTQKTEVSSRGERIEMSALDGHKVGSSETESQRGADPLTLEFITPPDTVKEKEKIILPAKPEENISGLKRKAEVWPSLNAKQKVEVLPSAGANELTSAGASLKKEVKEEYSCAICQVSTTSERALKDHLQGKKHKAKEAGLRKNGNNFSIGLCPKMISIPIELPEIPSSPCLEKGVNFDESMKPRIAVPAEANLENSETNNGLVVSRSPQLNQTLKQNESPSCSTGSGKRAPKKNFKFWCEMCQAGAFSESVMEAHRKGKKHLGLLPKQNAVGEVKLVRCQKETGEDGEGIASEVLGLVPVELKKGVNFDESMKPRIAIPAEADSENFETNNGLVVSRSPQLNQTLKQNESPSCSTGSGKRAREKNFKFWCEMCQVGAFSDTVMEAHRKGKKHLALLLKQKAVGEVELVRCQK